jgi:integrase
MARVKLTAGRVREFTCEPDKPQSFLWDTEAPGLAVRATSNGAKAYIFQGKLSGKSIRITIGDVAHWDIEGSTKDADGRMVSYGAREEARRLQALIDQKIDPRHAKDEEIAAAEAKRAKEQALRQGDERKLVAVRTAWDAYIEARTPKWGSRHLTDHQNLVSPGGKGVKRDELKPGTMASLMSLKLADLTQAKIQKWLEWEASIRPTQAALAFRLLRAFLNWCEDEPEYSGLASPDACTAKKTRESLPKSAPKTDYLQREQLPAWFANVRALHSPIIAAYLQTLLLTGSRREELLGMQWTDVDFKWNSLTIRDKAESKGGQDGERTIPMTPYVASLLAELHRINNTPSKVEKIRARDRDKDAKEWQPSPWVFSSKGAESGRLQEPAIAHRKACAAAGISSLTIHGLRRSFKSLAEWVEIPTGVVAQIMGHKPSATAEKHYTIRPLDLLRAWHTKYEAWILEQAKIEFKAGKDSQGLKAIG